MQIIFSTHYKHVNVCEYLQQSSTDYTDKMEQHTNHQNAACFHIKIARTFIIIA